MIMGCANNMARSLVEEFKLIVEDYANNDPAPKKCIIHDIYPDGNVDVTISLGDEKPVIAYRPCIGTPVINDEAVLLFIDGKINDGYVICTSKAGGSAGKLILTYDETTGDLCGEYEETNTLVTYNVDTGDLCVEYT